MGKRQRARLRREAQAQLEHARVRVRNGVFDHELMRRLLEEPPRHVFYPEVRRDYRPVVQSTRYTHPVMQPGDERNRRARELLLSHLSPEQAYTYQRDGYFEERITRDRPPDNANIISSRTKWYCFHAGYDSVIFELHSPGGAHMFQICTHFGSHGFGPRDDLFDWPVDDVMVAHLLRLRANPDFLRSAARAGCQPRGHQRPSARGDVFVPAWAMEPGRLHGRFEPQYQEFREEPHVLQYADYIRNIPVNIYRPYDVALEDVGPE